MARLNVDEVMAEGADPTRWLLILHGIYGAGRNWGSVARALVRERPEWGALLADMRQHGGSTGFAPPHTLEATAGDLAGLTVEGPVEAVLGHSFGGKVALLYGRDTESVRQVWVVDSTPDVREPEGSAWDMLKVLRSLPERFEEREDAVSTMTERRVALPIARWMTTNLDWTGEEYRWGIDFDDMEALLRDFFATDLWPLVESPPERLALHFVKATRSGVLSAEAVDRLRAAGARHGRVFVHEVEGGHWLNAEDPDALVQLLATTLD